MNETTPHCKTPLAVLLALSLLSAYALSAVAQDKPRADDVLADIIVTGTLIPQAKVETATPVIVITAEDLQVRGFATVADALQQSVFSTGSVQGPQYSNGFTQGAKTLSMFGLSPSYVKYLVDGLPMSDYPALYNGTDTFTSIGGIPMALVERIDILPGGQSSLYGSDAIAGVVNVILKKKLDGLEADVRYGFTQDGGGIDKTIALADGFEIGKLRVLAGVQYDKTTPIWGTQRALTSQYFASGTSAQTAERDYLVYGYFGPSGDGTNAYYFQDPAHCANVASQFGGSVQEASRANRGSFCGTTRAGYYTLNNGDESAQAYLRATYAMNDRVELYSDALFSNEVTSFSNGAGAFNTTFVNSAYNYFYDPHLDDLVTLQHIFAPEEAGSLDSTLSKNTTNLFRATLGGRGGLWGSWTYDLSATYNQQRLKEHTFAQLTQPLLDFYAPVFGENLGADPYGFGVSTFAPDYAAFYQPITPAQYASFSGFFNNHSQTASSLFRAQLTNAALFHLPGGNAGIAVVLEGGRQSWEYLPDPGFTTGNFFGYTTSGDSFGARTRSALTTELRLPVAPMLTVNASGRYDAYKVQGGSVNKATYTLGLEFRPWEALLLRGRYGTAFKAPTLSDEFQGMSGFYTSATDYWQCSVHGYSGANLADCPYPGGSVFGQTSGNTHLQPISAKVWNVGLVWAPTHAATINVDYLHWQISNEVSMESTDQLLRTESACRLGELDVSSPTCVAALAQVSRDPGTDQLLAVYTPKVNVSQEAVDALTVTANYALQAGRWGGFQFEGAWTDMIKHRYQQYAGDSMIDLLGDPYWSTDFKSRLNGSVTWDKNQWSATVYVSRTGRSPNHLATLYPEGYATEGAGTLAPWTLTNLNVRYTVRSGLQLSASVNNLFDTQPPTDNSYNGLTSQPYNVFNFNPYGRSFRVEAKMKFGK
ncbi:MAG: TonB-dependent receptor [Pseudomonadota bacterium]